MNSENTEHSEVNGPSKSVCRTCYEVIHPHAKKCVHCESYQDFRRYINLGNSALALLVALISTLTLGLPPLLTALQQVRSKHEQITVSIINSRPTGFKIYAYNAGNDFGILHDKAHFVLKLNDLNKCPQNYKCREMVNIRSGHDGAISELGIPPNKYALFRVSRNTNKGVFEVPGSNDCVLEYKISSQAEEARLGKVNFQCEKIVEE